MPFIVKPTVQETTITTGPGTYSLVGAVEGKDGFSVIGNGNSTEYYARDNTGWEAGIGVVSTSPSQITRAVILGSSTGSAISWGAGVKDIFCGPHPSMLAHSGIWPMTAACYFQWTSSTVCTLTRYNGRHIPVILNGVARYREIPAAGITLGTGGLSASTTYHVYCPFTGNLEASVTVPVVDADMGIRVKTGDQTRTYVGIVRTSVSTTFQDVETIRYVASWFNKRRKRMQSGFSTNRTTASTSVVELHAEARCDFVAFAEDWQQFTLCIRSSNSTASALNRAGVGVDSASVISGVEVTMHTPVTANETLMMTASTSAQVADGAHFATILGRVSAGTMTVVSSSTSLEGFIHG